MVRFALVAAVLGPLFGGSAEAAPGNDACAGALQITSLPFSDTVDTTTATEEPADPSFRCGRGLPGELRTKTVWYRYTAAEAINLEVRTEGSDYDTIVAAFTGSCGALTQVYCNEFDEDRPFGDGESRMFASLQPGESFLILAADEQQGNGGSLVLNVTETPIFAANTLHDADRPRVAAGPSGDFLAVWDNGEPGGIHGRLFDADGKAKGPEFEVSTSHTYLTAIARTPTGFVVAWGDYDDATTEARLLGPTGLPLGPEFLVSSVGGAYPAVAADAAGNFVVVWENGGSQIVARRFDATGTPLGSELMVSSFARWPKVARSPAGDFVVSWTDWSSLDGDDYGVFARRFDAGGTPLGASFPVNTTTDGSQGDTGSDIAAAPDGGFVVVWADGDYTSHPDVESVVMARHFDATGTPEAPEFQVSYGLNPGYFGSTYGDDDNYRPSIAADGSGRFVVAWTREYAGPYGRRLDVAGAPDGPEFQVDTIHNPYQYYSDVAASAGGDFAVVWGRDFECCTDTNSFGRGFAVRSCPATPDPDCKTQTLPLKSRIAVADKADDARDSLRWKFGKGEATTPAEVGNPLVSDGYALCLYDGAGALLLATKVDAGGTCGTRPCWKGVGAPVGSNGFRYTNAAGNVDGVRKMSVAPGVQGKTAAFLRAAGAALDLPSPPYTLPVTAQVRAATGTCWTTRFESAGVIKNEVGSFSAKASLP